MSKMKVCLGPPESGWLRVELSLDDQVYKFHPSYVPYDSITELVSALLKILTGYDKAIVRWNDEPVEREFVFDVAGERIDFRVYLINETAIEKQREEVFSFSGSVYEVIRPFWKALRDMESMQSLEEYEKQWHRPFPEREIMELTKRVKKMKEGLA